MTTIVLNKREARFWWDRYWLEYLNMMVGGTTLKKGADNPMPTPRAATLGRKLRRLRAQVILSGAQLLDWDDIERK